MKARRSFYNIVFGLISQIIIIAFGIIVPRLFIIKLGSEANGFMSSINQIFAYMTLLEAGVGAATIQALYKPLAADDKTSINGILSATSKYYKKTGKYYLLALIATSIIYPLVVKSQIGRVYILLVIFFTGMAGVMNYFFQAKFKLLLTAEGKTYIVTNISLIVTILINAVKIILLLLNYNIVTIQISYFIINFLQMLLIWIYIKKNYKWIDLKVKPDYSAISQKSSVLIHQISGMIFNNTDVIILTFFCGLKVVSVYTMYCLVFQMINSIISNLNSGFVFVLGSKYYENKDEFLNIYDSYELYYTALVFALYSITYILILPFMKLYTAGITDINYIDYKLPILFVTLNLFYFARSPGVNAITVAGHFKETRYRSIIESSINIAVSLICVYKYGIYGVLMGTIAALLYRTNDIIIYTSRHILNRSCWISYKRWFLNSLLFLITVAAAAKFNITAVSYISFLKKGVILFLIIVPLFFIVTSIFDIKSFKYTFGYIKKYFKLFVRS